MTLAHYHLALNVYTCLHTPVYKEPLLLPGDGPPSCQVLDDKDRSAVRGVSFDDDDDGHLVHGGWEGRRGKGEERQEEEEDEEGMVGWKGRDRWEMKRRK